MGPLANKLDEALGRNASAGCSKESLPNPSDEQSIALSFFINEVLEEEKARISRDIHDILSQQLTALKMDLSRIDAGRLSAKEVSERLRELMRLADTMIDSVRKIAMDLRPAMLDDLGLLATLEWRCQQFEAQTQMRCNFISDIRSHTFEKGFSNGVYRILQEALTNVKRHAKASIVTVSVRSDKNMFSLEVNDNGKGFTNVVEETSSGIFGMKERARLLGGTLSIQSEEKKGTTVTTILPINQV